ncbi:MAG: LptF/LptG family permease [Acidobacteria bacterium]|nr:LptF/LptG family permease [Acidobacteriota bacterium]MCW5949100.1 LptF/LptG family permease [Pyrinomonadaceae bacterium]
MKKSGILISRYLIAAVVPYFAFAVALLTVVLFLQQASRYSDLLFSANIRADLTWQLLIGILPNVIAYTFPMSILVGIVIGLSRMQGDSELVAVRAAGTSNLQIALPMLALGVLLSIFTFWVNLQGVPLAAKTVRQAAMAATIAKLEAPIEPGVFYTEAGGYAIYAGETDPTNGRLGSVFIAQEDTAGGVLRLITAEAGRVGFLDESTTLTLEKASVLTVPLDRAKQTLASESIEDIAISLRSKRTELIERLANSVRLPDELGLDELNAFASTAGDPKERLEAQILFQRRIILSISPILFSLLGTFLVLRWSRGGRGFGIFLSLVALIGFYLVSFLGEQVARTGGLPSWSATVMPVGLAIVAIGLLAWRSRVARRWGIGEWMRSVVKGRQTPSRGVSITDQLLDITAGLRDFEIIVDLVKYFVLTLAFLLTLFLVFTAFEMWRFASSIDGGPTLLSKYLVYLLPFAALQIAPAAAMIATVAAYVIRSRNNELVTWISAGQSVYRLMLPAIVFAAVVGAASFVLQETIAPASNQLQDDIRATIRAGGKRQSSNARTWVKVEDAIVSFRVPGAADGNITASDNDMASHEDHMMRDLVVLRRADNRSNLQAAYLAEFGRWSGNSLELRGSVSDISINGKAVEVRRKDSVSVPISMDPTVTAVRKPNQMTFKELRLASGDQDEGNGNDLYGVALNKRVSIAFLPLTLALFSLPFSIVLRRGGRSVMAIAYVVGLWLLFTGSSSLLEQYGVTGVMAPWLSVWIPIAVFAGLGTFLIGRMRS